MEEVKSLEITFSLETLYASDCILLGIMKYSDYLAIYVRYLCSVIGIPLIILVNKKLYSNIRNEEHLEKGKVIQYIIKTYALVQCISWPCLLAFHGTLFLSISVFGLFHNYSAYYLISTFRFCMTFVRDYVQFHSLIIALCRYVFIVFDTKAEVFGIKNLRALFISSSVAIPFLSALTYEMTIPIEEAYLHLFYNQTHPTIATEKNTYSNEVPSLILYQSPVFSFVQKYFPTVLFDAIHLFDIIMFLIMYSNILEGIIYAHTFLVCNR